MHEPKWLTGWKSIARHFDVSVRTIQRWHQKWGMPILRLGQKKPMAKIEDLDMWAQRKAVIL